MYGLTESCGPACLISPEEAHRQGRLDRARRSSTPTCASSTSTGATSRPAASARCSSAGAHVMKGYWNRPEATAETIRDGWLHTGDLATVDAEGFVYIQDRKKDMIISGGENIYPAEIENVILVAPAGARRRGHRPGEREVGRVAARRSSCKRRRRRSTEADVLAALPGQARALQAAAGGALRRRDPAQPGGQDAEAPPARALPRAGAGVGRGARSSEGLRGFAGASREPLRDGLTYGCGVAIRSVPFPFRPTSRRRNPRSPSRTPMLRITPASQDPSAADSRSADPVRSAFRPWRTGCGGFRARSRAERTGRRNPEAAPVVSPPAGAPDSRRGGPRTPSTQVAVRPIRVPRTLRDHRRSRNGTRLQPPGSK